MVTGYRPCSSTKWLPVTLPLRLLYSGSSAHQRRSGHVSGRGKARCWRPCSAQGSLPQPRITLPRLWTVTFTVWYTAHVIMIWHASMWPISYKWKWTWYVMERDLVTTPSSVRWATKTFFPGISVLKREIYFWKLPTFKLS